MRGQAVARAKNSRLGYLFAVAIVSATAAVGTQGSPVSAQAGSMVSATVCAATSTITISTPASDSIVTNPIVQVSGSVTQSSQIEIEIDDEFDSNIPLDIGQTTYNGSVQLPAGTHTIKVTAVSVCPSANGTASSVVTYEAPPQTPSAGSSTPTNLGGGVTVGDAAHSNQSAGIQQGGLFQQIILGPLGTVGSWLNINRHTIDYAHADTASSMGLVRAVTFGAGLYLSIIGLAPALAASVATLPVFASAIPGDTPPLRTRWLRRAGRVAGLLLVFGTLFL